MTVGVFDGVHRGHQLLIERILRRGIVSTVVTFRESPRRVFAARGAAAGSLSAVDAPADAALARNAPADALAGSRPPQARPPMPPPAKPSPEMPPPPSVSSGLGGTTSPIDALSKPAGGSAAPTAGSPPSVSPIDAPSKPAGGASGAILSLRQKLEIFEDLGVSQIILIDFSQDFSTLRGRDFINILIRRGKMQYLAVGSNFRCGYRLDTGAEDIRELTAREGILTDIVPRTLPVSSSLIRQAIAQGDLAGAAAALGRSVALDLTGIPASGLNASPASGFNASGFNAGELNAGAGGAGSTGADLSKATGCRAYDLAAQGRVLPPEGTYPAYIREQGRQERAEIAVEQGNILVPLRFNAPEGVEFICS